MTVSSTPSKRVALVPINVNTVAPLLLSFKSRPHSSAITDSLPLTPVLTPKFGLVKSFSSLTPSHTRGSHMPHGNARRLETFSGYKITNSKNVKADLAATKLKLRLQLALYKLRQKKRAGMASAPNIRVSKPCNDALPLLLRYLLRRSFTSSANVNLQKPKPALSAPRLNAVASAETSAENAANEAATSSAETRVENMRLYHIKPLSLFYNAYSHRLPLTDTNTQRLPPVHKILCTPIKAASRALLQLAQGSSAGVNSHSDETIDEAADDHTGSEFIKRRTDILGSSPLRYNTFGTPDSFAVAKSLLQLGLGLY